jgi:hypothetical protein
MNVHSIELTLLFRRTKGITEGLHLKVNFIPRAALFLGPTSPSGIKFHPWGRD